MIHYYLKDTVKAQVALEILEGNGKLIKKFSTKPDKKAKEEVMKMKPNGNRFIWKCPTRRRGKWAGPSSVSVS